MMMLTGIASRPGAANIRNVNLKNNEKKTPNILMDIEPAEASLFWLYVRTHTRVHSSQPN